MTLLTGDNLIGSNAVRSKTIYVAVAAGTGEVLAPPFSAAGAAEVRAACDLAQAAFPVFRALDAEVRARFLETIADGIEALGDALILRAMAESGLPRGRLEGERGRTTGQLRLFAAVVRRGDAARVRLEPAQPDRKPAPRPDLRQRQIPLGPVAVFGASNFPMAFSVAGGDTASALAAGCPVVVKAHPAHPGTSELVGRAIQTAATDCAMPEGVFSLLGGPAETLGEALVRDPRIKAVAFTGSRRGGLSLAADAAARAEPIPVYAEMGSVNPVFLAPQALKAGAEALGAAFVASLTLGAGQFCTSPGLVFAVDGPELERFLASAGAALATAPAAVMLTSGIRSAFELGVEALVRTTGVRRCMRGAEDGDGARAALFETDLATFSARPELSQEVFGAAALVVRCPDVEAMVALVGGLEGQLTATLHLAPGDEALAARLIPELELKVGRILANGWPTGVEVGEAMVHGGPFPATTDSRTTSVGTLAIERFLRPVCYQNIPEALLPLVLRDDMHTASKRAEDRGPR